MKKQIVLITGATSGIGKEAAELLAKNGYTVYGTGRSAKGDVVNTYENGGSLTLLPLDVTNDASAEACVEKIVKKEGRIDALINNAGFGIAGSVEDTTVEEMRGQLETNLFGVHRMVRLVLPVMRKNGYGRIVNISSVAGYIAIPYQTFYTVSKYGIEGYSRALAAEVGGFGIKVVLIQPGDTKTGFTKDRVTVKNVSEAYREKLDESIKRMAHDEQNGTDPKVTAKKILKAVRRKHPPTSITVGWQYKLIKFAMHILPERLVGFVVKLLYA